MDLKVWQAVPIGNACTLEPIENVERHTDLKRGVPFAARFPRDATLRMDRKFKKDTGLTDDLSNMNRIKVCSGKLTEFLKKQKLKNVEFLPVTILDHKGKVASKEYTIVHPVGLQDALDVEASKPRFNRILKTQIDEVERFVVDVRRIEPGVRIFRLAGFYSPVLIDAELAKSIEAEGFRGSAFQELDRYGH